MKNIFTIFMVNAFFLFAFESAHAQDSTSSPAIKHINQTSEQADKLYGKKIQQQTLALKLFEKADTVAVQNQHKKKYTRCKRKRR